MAEENPYVSPNAEQGPGAEHYLSNRSNSLPAENDLESEEWRESASYEYASFFRRASAKVIDAVCFNLVFLFVFGLFAGIKAVVFTADNAEDGEHEVAYELDGYEIETDAETGGQQWARIEARRNSETPAGLSDGMLTGIGVAAFMVFAGLSEWRSGQSLGKLLFGIQVVDDGPPALPSIGMAIGRNVGLIVDSLFVGLFAYFVMRTNPRKQRAGDLAASTLVVLKRSIPGSPLSTSTAFIQGLLASVLSIVVTAIILLMIDPTF